MNLPEFNILFITYPKKNCYFVKKIIFHRHDYNVTLMFSAFFDANLYSENDVNSK